MSANAEPESTRLTKRWGSSVADRPTINVATPAGGWGAPWPNVAEIEAVLSHDKWTLVGGLMAQLHGIHAGIDSVRPTNDVDMVLHVETTRGIASETARALESLGYKLAPSVDDRNSSAHRFKRGDSTIDVVTRGLDMVDVLVADHVAPRVVEKLRGRTMVAIEGGTQALRRTINARLRISAGRTTTVSVICRTPHSCSRSSRTRTPSASSSPGRIEPVSRCWNSHSQSRRLNGDCCQAMCAPMARLRCGS